LGKGEIIDRSTGLLDDLPIAILALQHDQVVYQNKVAIQLLSTLTHKKEFLQTLAKDEALCLNNFFSGSIKKSKITLSDVRIKSNSAYQLYNVELVRKKDRTTLIFNYSVTKDDLEKRMIHFSYTIGKQTTMDYIHPSIYKTLGYTSSQLKKSDRLLSTAFKTTSVLKFNTYLKNIPIGTGTIDFPFISEKGSKEFTLNYEKRQCKLTGRLKIMGTLQPKLPRDKHKLLEEGFSRKLDLVFNNSTEVITFYTFLPRDKYLFVSPNIKRILGFDANDLMRQSNFFESRLTGDNKQYRLDVKRLAHNQKHNKFEQVQFDFKILNTENREVWIENSLVPIKDKEGKIEFYMNILRDITAKKEASIEAEIQKVNYQNLLDNSPVAYLIHDRGVCVYVNQACLDLFGLRKREDILGKFLLDFLPAHERKSTITKLNKLYKHKQPSAFTFFIHDAKNNPLEIEINSVLTKFNNHECVLSLVNNIGEKQSREVERLKNLATELSNRKLKHEIREREQVEKTLKDKTAQLSSILESSTHLVWTVDSAYRLTSFNNNFAQVVYDQRGLKVIQGMRIDEFLDADRLDYVSFWYARYDEAFDGKKLEFEKADSLNGTVVYRRVFINPIINSEGKINELSCIANDITESKNYEQRLLLQTSKLSAIFDSSHHYIWSIDKEGHLTSFNKNYFDLVSVLYNTVPYVGFKLDRGVLSQDKTYNEELKNHYELAFKGVATNFEIQTRDRDHQLIYLDIFLNPIYENSRVIEVSGIAHNITEQKQVQQKMEVSLKEKEILLREVHHRVKNNMQVISSILNLQSSYVSDEYALMLLQESQNRIKTMAYIHESLYQNKSFTSVNFTEYARTLVRNIVQSYSYSSDKINLIVEAQPVTLSLDNSIPVGLILNELMTNAIKHAFPGNRKGTIVFSLLNDESFVFLEVKDDGVGFAPGIDILNNQSLGFQLVHTLTEQVEGELKYDSIPGETVISLRFRK